MEVLKDKKEVLLWACFALLFVLLYSYGSYVRSLYLDEGAVITLTQVKSVGDINKRIILFNEVHPPLYFYIVYGLEKLFGFSPFALRLFSVFASLCTSIFAFLIAKRTYGKSPAMFSLFLFLVFSFFMKFSSEVRMYPLLTLSWWASYFFFIEILERKKKIYIVPFTLINIAALYTHYFSFFMILSYGIIIVWEWIKKSIKARDVLLFLGSYLFLFLSFLPWLRSFLIQTGFKNFTLRPPPTLGFLFKTLTFMALGDNCDAYMPSSVLILAGVCILASIVFFLYTHRDKLSIYLVFYAFFPMIFSFILSKYTNFRVFNPKYFLFVIPSFAIIYGKIIWDCFQSKNAARIVVWVLVTVLVVCNGISYYLFNLYPDNFYGNANWEKVCMYLNNVATSEDLLIISPSMFYTVFHIYYRGKAPYLLADTYSQLEKYIPKYAKGRKRIILCFVPYHVISLNEKIDLKLNRRFPVVNFVESRNYYPRNRIRVVIYRISKDEGRK